MALLLLLLVENVGVLLANEMTGVTYICELQPTKWALGSEVEVRGGEARGAREGEGRGGEGRRGEAKGSGGKRSEAALWRAFITGSWLVRVTWYEKSSNLPSGGTKLMIRSRSHRSREIAGCKDTSSYRHQYSVRSAQCSVIHHQCSVLSAQ